jgi:hypothetical protein
MRLQHPNINSKLIIPKFIKIRWSTSFFGSFVHHFQFKLRTQGSNFILGFGSMNELEIFFVDRGLDSKLLQHGTCKIS